MPLGGLLAIEGCSQCTLDFAFLSLCLYAACLYNIRLLKIWDQKCLSIWTTLWLDASFGVINLQCYGQEFEWLSGMCHSWEFL